MTTQDPNQQILNEINSIESDFRELHSKVQLSSARDSVNEMDSTIGQLDSRIATLRTRGYAFGKDLESKSKDLKRRWQMKAPNIKRKIEQESREMETELNRLEPQVRSLAPMKARPAAAKGRVSSIRSAVSNLESRVNAAANVVSGMYEGESTEFDTLERELKLAEYALDQIDGASFSLAATEAVIRAVEAVMVEGKEDKDDPKGTLFLTDQRILFEQKQEVPTKKVLFVATEKKMVQELLFEAPVRLAEDTETSKRGLFKNEDHIEIKFGSGAPKPHLHFHIFYQDCQEWQTLIKHVNEGGFDKDRAIAIAEEVIEKVKDAPTICPQCGGKFSQPVLRGQDSIECEYCGHVVRL
jgi:DNA-directed RNA polymerase subunit RPC12/RpoP